MVKELGDRAAAMRAAFFDDLHKRLMEIAQIAERLRRGDLPDDEARAALQAQLHDIKGCGAPYGVPAATELARRYEQMLCRQAASSQFLADIIGALLGDFRRLMA